MLTQAQREARRYRVGASEVAALPGIDEHRFVTPADIYDRIVYGTSREPSLNMMVGAYLEPTVVAMARRFLGLPLRACTRPYVHPTLPLTASPDAYAGPGALAEVKVTGAWVTVPRYVYWQVQTQLLLTRRATCYVVVLAGSSLTYEVIDADREAQDIVLEAVRLFWRDHLAPLNPPARITRPLVLEDLSRV
jgi:hypothetical protein